MFLRNTPESLKKVGVDGFVAINIRFPFIRLVPVTSNTTPQEEVTPAVNVVKSKPKDSPSSQDDAMSCDFK